MTPEFCSVAAAVLDHGGHPVASFTLTYEGSRVDEDERAALAESVRASAAELSRRIGGLRPTS